LIYSTERLSAELSLFKRTTAVCRRVDGEKGFKFNANVTVLTREQSHFLMERVILSQISSIFRFFDTILRKNHFI